MISHLHFCKKADPPPRKKVNSLMTMVPVRNISWFWQMERQKNIWPDAYRILQQYSPTRCISQHRAIARLYKGAFTS